MRLRELVAWALVLLLSGAMAWQAGVASKAEGRAEVAEERARQSSQHAEQAHFESNQIVAEAANHLEQREHEIKNLRQRIERQLRQKQQAITTTPVISTPETGQVVETEVVQPVTKAACEPLPDKINEWPVAACSMAGIDELVGVVPYLAAIEGLQLLERAKFAETKVEALETELTATRTALEDSQRAMVAYKQAVKGSRLKRFLRAASKPALVVIGIAIGRATR